MIGIYVLKVGPASAILGIFTYKFVAMPTDCPARTEFLPIAISERDSSMAVGAGWASVVPSCGGVCPPPGRSAPVRCLRHFGANIARRFYVRRDILSFLSQPRPARPHRRHGPAGLRAAQRPLPPRRLPDDLFHQPVGFSSDARAPTWMS